MGIHFDSRAAAEAHLYFQNFRLMTRRGHTHKWRKGNVRACIQTITGSDVVIVGVWEV